MFCSSCGDSTVQAGAEAGHESYGRRRESVFFGLPSGVIPDVALGAIIIVIRLT
jgi:hypothetical protein